MNSLRAMNIRLPSFRKNKPGLTIMDSDKSLVAVPRVFINLPVMQKIKCFVDLCPYEINGIGTVERLANDFYITDAFLLKQYTKTRELHVEIDPRSLGEYIYNLVKRRDSAANLKLQWHSHANAGVFYSSEDMGTISGYMNDFMISLVMNKRGDYCCRLDLFKPFNVSFDVRLEILVPPLTDNVIARCRQEIQENVFKITPILRRQRPIKADGLAASLPLDYRNVQIATVEPEEELSLKEASPDDPETSLLIEEAPEGEVL